MLACLPDTSPCVHPAAALPAHGVPPPWPRRRSEELQLPHLAAFSRLALARFHLLHPHQQTAADGDGVAGGADGSTSGAEQPCGSSLAVGGAVRDVAHLHLATRLAAAAPPAPPSSSTSASARVLRGVGDLFTSTALLFGRCMQGWWREGAGGGAAVQCTEGPSLPCLPAGLLREGLGHCSIVGAGAVLLAADHACQPLILRARVPAVCRSSAGTQASSAAEVEHLTGGAHLLQAAAWELRGSRHLSQAHALACLDACDSTARAHEQCTALAQLATSVAARHGYAAAEALLAAADERFPRAESQVLTAARLAVAHDRALHRRDFHAAMGLASQMAALASPTGSVDITLRQAGRNTGPGKAGRQRG